MKRSILKTIAFIAAAVIMLCSCGSQSNAKSVLAKPDILNGGSGEFNENSKDCIYLYLQWYEGSDPDGVILLRKSSSDEDFTEINYTMLNEDLSSGAADLLDDTVVPGEIYIYKARTYTEHKGEKNYSPESDEITIPAANLTAEYEIGAVTDAWDHSEENTFAIKVTSKEYNGVTIFYREPAMVYYVRNQAGAFMYDAHLTGYSQEYAGDGTHWEKVPLEGLRLSAGECVYLEYTLTELNPETAASFADITDYKVTEELRYGGDTAEESLLEVSDENYGAVKYEGSGVGATYLFFDLAGGTGTAFCNFD